MDYKSLFLSALYLVNLIPLVFTDKTPFGDNINLPNLIVSFKVLTILE